MRKLTFLLVPIILIAWLSGCKKAPHESPATITGLSAETVKYGGTLSIYGTSLDKSTVEADSVFISDSIKTYILTPVSVSSNEIKVEIYNQKSPYQLLDLTTFRIGIKISSQIKWSQESVSIVSNWKRLKDFPGGQRYKGAAFSVHGKGYMGLGTKLSNAVQNDLWEYTPSSDSWLKVADFPGQGRILPAVFMDADNGYVGGGQSLDNPDQLPLIDFYKFNPSTNTWTRIADNTSVEKSFPGYSVSTSDLQHFANLKSGFLHKYSTTDNTWSLVYSSADGTINRSPQSFCIKNRIFIIGGCNNPVLNGTTNQVWEFNESTNTITKKADFPGSSRYGGFSFSIDNYGYIGCGVYYIFNGVVQYLTDVYRYNPENDTWIQMPSFPAGYKLNSISFNIDSKAYVLTGYDYNTRLLTGDVWEFSAN